MKICYFLFNLGVSDVTSNEINNDIFKLDILQETPEMDGDNEECNYDYTGDVIIKKNSFGYLRREVRIFHFHKKKSLILVSYIFFL